MMQSYRNEASSTFSRYYNLPSTVKPICGDYLANVAMTMEKESEEKKEWLNDAILIAAPSR